MWVPPLVSKLTSLNKMTNITPKLASRQWLFYLPSRSSLSAHHPCILLPPPNPDSSTQIQLCVTFNSRTKFKESRLFYGIRILNYTIALPRWLPHNICIVQFFLTIFIVSLTKDFTKDKDLFGEMIPKKLQSCLLSFISATCYLYNTSSHKERLRKQQHSIFYLFLFIDDHVHNNFYIVMFHFVWSINLLKLFLRFILLLPCGLYVRCYGSHICRCAEIFPWIVWKIFVWIVWQISKIYLCEPSENHLREILF